MTSKSHIFFKTRVGIYNEPFKLLTAKGDYDPEDADIKILKLQTLADEAFDILKELSEKGTAFINARSPVLNYFDGPGGLSEIAARAKRNVKRNYGKDSPEYKASKQSILKSSNYNFVESLPQNKNVRLHIKNKTSINF